MLDYDWYISKFLKTPWLDWITFIGLVKQDDNFSDVLSQLN